MEAVLKNKARTTFHFTLCFLFRIQEQQKELQMIKPLKHSTSDHLISAVYPEHKQTQSDFESISYFKSILKVLMRALYRQRRTAQTMRPTQYTQNMHS